MNLEQIYATESGKIIRKHLEKVIEEMDKLTILDKNLNASELSIEVLSDIKAIYKLKQILQITSPEQKSDKNVIEDTKKKYGL